MSTEMQLPTAPETPPGRIVAPPPGPVFGVEDVMRLTGGMASQVDRLQRVGAVVPAIISAPITEGNVKRVWTFRQVIEVSIALDLYTLGIPWDEIAIILQLTVRRHWSDLADRRLRKSFAVLVLEYTQRLCHAGAPDEFRTVFERPAYLPKLRAVRAVADLTRVGHTVRAINVVHIIDALQASTGERL
jgi:hypothetical protein